MEGEVEKARRRRRLPSRKVNGDQEHVGNTPSAPDTDAGEPGRAPQENVQDGNAKKPPQKRGVRKPRGSKPAQPDRQASVPPQPGLTWQQQNMLSVDAPAFHPGAASESRQPEAQAGPSRAGKSRSRRHPKPPSHHVPAHRPAEAASHEQASSATEADDEHDGENEVPMCLLCCGPMTLTSFGSCNHKAACGRCCLRMRMCYDSTDCPLCKAELKEVVIAPWRPDLPDFAHFKANPEASVRARGGQLGPGTVLVDRWVSARRPPSSRLLHDLVRSTGIACAACDPTGHHPFSRYSQLEGHVKEAHGCFLCGMCLREGRNFPLDAPLYPSEAEMKEHAQAAHPRCSFCRGRAFFDGDALWRHMQEKHFRCQLCEPAPGGDFPWYNTAHHLQQHLAADHFACDDPDCATSLVAFATAEELKRHYMERHSSRMMRWNPAASRPLHLDIQFVRRPGEGARPGGRGRDRERQAAGAGRRQRDFAREVEGGFTVIDDDLGMQDGADWPAAGAGSDAGPFVGFPGYSGRRRGEPVQSADAFPSLAAVAAEAVADNSHSNGMNGNGNGAGARRRPPPLVKRTVRCPCGRKVTHHVVEEGQEVPALECDAVCNLEGRRAQLADAFGIEDREHHTSAFDRRPAEWSGALLAAAKKDRAWVEGIERELASFLANKTLKRHTLSPMPRSQRQLVHGIAEQYGLATASTGQEPRRCVELFKTGTNPGLPSRLLSRVAPTVLDEEVAALLVAAQGHPIRFIDIAPTTDLHYYLRRWDGRYCTEWKGGSEAIVRFDDAATKTEVLDAFGGGIRGLFKVDRAWHPQVAVPTSGGAASATGMKGWGAGAASGDGGEGLSSGASWTAVAAPQRAAQGQASTGSGGGEGSAAALPTGWSVIGGKREVRPVIRPVATANGAAEAAQPNAGRLAALSLEDLESS